MLRLKILVTGVTVLGLLLMIGAVAGCSEASRNHSGHETVEAPLIESLAIPQLDASSAPPVDLLGTGDTIASSPPCAGAADGSCAPRDVSVFSLFEPKPTGAGYFIQSEADSVEDVLEKGLRLAEASPAHLAVRGTTVSGSVRCDWRGVARTAAQRERAVRYWLGLTATDALPSATEVERRFMEPIDRASLRFPETEKVNFRTLARGGLSTEYLFLTCYVDYTSSEFILGAGPTTLTLAYDHMAEVRSYALYQRAHTAGEFGNAAIVSASAYQAALDQAVANSEATLSGIVEGRESVVFLAPMGAHHAIAIEAWQVIDQWDVQTVDGTVNAMRYGTVSGDPEHTQTLANLKTRITTAAGSDDFSDDRIANYSGLQQYYRDIGAYADITPGDGETTTFTPAQPPPKHACLSGTAVSNPRDNRPLVQDCGVLLALKDTLAGTGTLNWSTSTAMSSWDGVTTGGTPTRVTGLALASKSLTGTIPAELGSLSKLDTLNMSNNRLTGAIPAELGSLSDLGTLNLSTNQLTGEIPAELVDLSSLTVLKLATNQFTGCIPLALRQVATNDLDDLGLLYCGDPPPAPADLSASLAGSMFTITWSAVTGADQYEVQYQMGSESDWVALPATEDTSTTFTPTTGTPSCDNYEFRIRARGDGVTFIPSWGTPSEVGACSHPPVFAEETYAYTFADEAPIGYEVGTVSATDPDAGETVTYHITDGNADGKFALDTNTGALTVAGALDHSTVASYTLMLQARDSGGAAGTATAQISIVDMPSQDVPEPEGLSVVVEDGAFVITWDPVIGASKYAPQYRVPGRWADLEPFPTAARYVFRPDDGIPCETDYQFRVWAHGDGILYRDAWSPTPRIVFDLTTDACNQAPEFAAESYEFMVPEDAAVAAAVGTVSATDPDAGEDDTVTYTITEGNADGHFALDASSGAITVAAALDYEMIDSYTLTVEANDGNEGTGTVTVTVTVTNVAEDTPPAPEGLSVTLSEGTFSISWDEVAEASQYEVQYRTGSDQDWVPLPAVTDTSATFAPEDGPACGTTYEFQVRAYGDDVTHIADWGMLSTSVSQTTAECPGAPPPTGLSVSLSESTFALTWDAVAGASEYEVQYRTGTDQDWVPLPAVETLSTTYSPTDGPACGTTYEFQVRSYGDGTTHLAEWGAVSAAVSETTAACNVAPVFGEATYAFSVSEAVAVGAAVGSIAATDSDTGDSVTYAITTGNADGKFALDGNTGAITVAAALDYATTASYTLTVEASDGRDGTATATVSISVSEAACSNGVVVADAANNPGLVADCNTLLSAKSTLAGTASLNWSTDTAITSWDGVYVSGTPSRVLGLDLRRRGLTGSLPAGLASLTKVNTLWLHSNQLSGTIPPELGGMTALRDLNLHVNRLSGTIPTELGNLTNLRELNLHENQLSGSIPSELGNLTNVNVLRLNDNQLSGSIPLELGNLTRLTNIKLADNQLTGCIPPALRNVNNNDLDELGLLNCAPAPAGLSISLSDGTFSISWNAVTGAIRYEAQYREGSDGEWVALPAVTTLSTTFSPTSDPACGTTYEFQVRAYGDGTTIAAGWGALSTIVSEATAACNQAPAFGQESYSFMVSENAAIGDAVGTVSALDSDAADSVAYDFTGGNEERKFAIARSSGAITVAGSLDHETTPSYALTVQASDGHQGTATATVSITVTDVAENAPPAPASPTATLADGTFNIGWQEVTGASKYRVQFHTGDGSWVDAVAETVNATATFSPSAGPACETTYSFRIQAFGDGDSYIAEWGTAATPSPVTTGACNQEPAFDATSYEFSIFEDAATGDAVGTVSATDPDAADTVTYDITAGNEDGKFALARDTGAITVAGALDYDTTASYTLTVQVSDGNGDTATVEVSIALIPLTCSNGIVVPDAANSAGLVGDCTTLLGIKETLAGTATLNWSTRIAIADWDGVTVTGTPRRVTRLELNSKGLSGSVPAALGSLSNLTHLYLTSNQLSGAIPSELGNLSQLVDLYLSSNRLSGTIPTELGKLPQLTRLHLNNNQLSGTIPSELGNLSQLVRLFLSTNRLSGTIPAELGDLSNLTHLIVNSNQLSGAIPTELGDLSALTHLWLTNNQLSGTIPAELGSLSALIQLLLRDNRLTGAIPSELGNLSNLQSLTLLHNQFSGCIPPALRNLGANDLSQLRLLYCDDVPSAPGGLSLSLSDGTFSLTWNTVTGASQYEVQYRTGSDQAWVPLPAETDTSTTFAPEGGPACGTTYEFQVRAYGDGTTHVADWSVTSDPASHTTGACE